MRWTSKPEWAPILVAAFAGALAVPFVPLLNALFRRSLTFIPSAAFALTGLVMGLAVGLVTWRLLLAGFVQVTERGVVLIRFEQNRLLPWEKLDVVDETAHGEHGKPRFRLDDRTEYVLSYLRLPRQDFHRMRTKLVDPVLILPPEARRRAAAELLEANGRDDLILVILRVYAGLLGFMAVVLSFVL